MIKKTMIFTFFLVPALSYGLDFEFESSNKKVHLIELFTSQSCSSCPPAEKWINQFKESKELWKSIIPIEFHVDYWNHLSWKDPFSKGQFTKRQYTYNNILKKGVYTPQVILNGKDWRAWRSEALYKNKSKTGKLLMKYESSSKRTLIQYSPNVPSKKQPLKCFIAFMHGNLKTKIKSGENSGKSLAHEFVVSKLISKDMKRDGHKYSCQFSEEISPHSKEQNQSIAIWVANKKSFKIIQATGGYLPIKKVVPTDKT